jgi:hypothetical protein
MEASSKFNKEMDKDRKSRLPFLESQTRVAQTQNNILFVSPYQRISVEDNRSGQLIAYPLKKWYKRKRYLNEVNDTSMLFQHTHHVYLQLKANAHHIAEQAALDGNSIDALMNHQNHNHQFHYPNTPNSSLHSLTRPSSGAITYQHMQQQQQLQQQQQMLPHHHMGGMPPMQAQPNMPHHMSHHSGHHGHHHHHPGSGGHHHHSPGPAGMPHHPVPPHAMMSHHPANVPPGMMKIPPTNGKEHHAEEDWHMHDDDDENDSGDDDAEDGKKKKKRVGVSWFLKF